MRGPKMQSHIPNAKDLMTKEVIYAKRNTSILTALELMRQNKVSGLPVVEDDMTLVGIITEKDVLKLYYECEQSENKVVGDFMTQDVICFNESITLPDICNCLIENPFRRVPVTSNGKVIGIISRPDIIEYILEYEKTAKKT
jgi:CBS domain-containing protein